MTEEEFLKNPMLNYYRNSEQVRDEWLASAWADNENFRSNISYGFERWVSKNGELTLMEDELKVLARALPMQQIADLYVRIRECSPNRESEFRSTFEAIFSENMAQLPKPLPKEE